MKKISLRELQLMELEILKNFDSFCRQYSLRYCLAEGTLLGAVRHKGFIPWDDDIDVYMPRQDYIKFNEIYSHTKYILKSPLVDRKWNMPIAKLMNMDIKLIESGTTAVKGIWIDIFPVDGWPDSLEAALKYKKKLQMFNYLCFGRDAVLSRSKHGFWRTCAKTAVISFAHLIPHGVMSRYINQVASNTYPYQDSKYVGNISFQESNKIVRIKKAHFEDRIELQFEDAMFYAPRNYDDYLTQTYGNYMKLPPVSERQTHPMEFI